MKCNREDQSISVLKKIITTKTANGFLISGVLLVLLSVVWQRDNEPRRSPASSSPTLLEHLGCVGNSLSQTFESSLEDTQKNPMDYQSFLTQIIALRDEDEDGKITICMMNRLQGNYDPFLISWPPRFVVVIDYIRAKTYENTKSLWMYRVFLYKSTESLPAWGEPRRWPAMSPYPSYLLMEKEDYGIDEILAMLSSEIFNTDSDELFYTITAN